MSNKNVGAAAAAAADAPLRIFCPFARRRRKRRRRRPRFHAYLSICFAGLSLWRGVGWMLPRGRCRPSQGEILRRYFQFQDAAECRNGMSTGERGIEFTRPTRQHCGGGPRADAGGRWRPLRKIWTGSGTDMIPAVFARDTMKLLLNSRTSLHLAEVWSCRDDKNLVRV